MKKNVFMNCNQGKAVQPLLSRQEWYETKSVGQQLLEMLQPMSINSNSLNELCPLSGGICVQRM